jgi:hypothetical protein
MSGALLGEVWTVNYKEGLKLCDEIMVYMN